MRHEQTLVGSNYEIRAEGQEVIRAEGRELMWAEGWEVMWAESQNEGEVKNVGQHQGNLAERIIHYNLHGGVDKGL